MNDRENRLRGGAMLLFLLTLCWLAVVGAYQVLVWISEAVRTR